MNSEALAVRLALTDAVTAYAMALDAGDWAVFRALFEDEIEVDYSSLGSIHTKMPAQAWADRCRVLGAFDATHHKVTNFQVEIAGETATVTSYVDAAHFIGELQGFACGTYVHRFRRHGATWKIVACAFRLAGHQGGRAAFDAAFDAARARFESAS
ncbi:nuclear transport factor 2 family protein [Phenylobacterium sp.]|uniref:nuclear transport factor 2 family protein n=1 Tax=Phenylobacterium sp. TaxID=1871053 RepID=UPI0025EA266C|nr:nuclear transport factor 2 family protein [Phenylobacterium sp.]